MNIGTAIRMLRKHKGLSQRELGAAAGISVNALSLIETNATFPQKSTIQSICESLEIPVSYLLFFSISDDDIPENNKIAFNALNKAVSAVLLNEIK